MRKVSLLSIVIFCAVIGGWGQNLYKLSECDFAAPYKAEVMHGIGIIPVVGAFTGWMDFGK